MASMVETEAAMARWEMKEETLQNTSPNTQSLYGGQLQMWLSKISRALWFDYLSTLKIILLYRQLLLCHVDEVERCVEECIQEVGEAQAEHQEICHAPHFRVL